MRWTKPLGAINIYFNQLYLKIFCKQTTNKQKHIGLANLKIIYNTDYNYYN